MLCEQGQHSIVGQLYFKTNKQAHRKRDQICGYRRGGAGNWMKAAETYKLPAIR